MKEVVANAATQDRSSLLQLEHVGKIYGGKDAVTCALNDIPSRLTSGSSLPSWVLRAAENQRF